MPLYDYLCTRCGTEIEIIRSITESDSLPTGEETHSCKCDPPDWKKLIKGKPTIMATYAWGRHGGKGNW